jgi:hypothetical protein
MYVSHIWTGGMLSNFHTLSKVNYAKVHNKAKYIIVITTLILVIASFACYYYYIYMCVVEMRNETLQLLLWEENYFNKLGLSPEGHIEKPNKTKL